MNLVCPKCGYKNPEGSSFCEKDGCDLRAFKKCRKCGHVNDSKTKYCADCGASFSKLKKWHIWIAIVILAIFIITGTLLYIYWPIKTGAGPISENSADAHRRPKLDSISTVDTVPATPPTQVQNPVQTDPDPCKGASAISAPSDLEDFLNKVAHGNSSIKIRRCYKDDYASSFRSKFFFPEEECFMVGSERFTYNEYLDRILLQGTKSIIVVETKMDGRKIVEVVIRERK